MVASGRLYTMGWSGGRDTVWCLEAATGRVLWKQSYRCPRHGRHAAGDKNQYCGPTSTPTVDAEAGRLVTLSCDGDLVSWDLARGTRAWALNLYEAFGAKRRPNVGGGRRDYGYITAPFPRGEQLVVQVGSPRGNLVAFDRRTGRPSWASECTDYAGHAGGMSAIEIQGIPCLAVLTIRRLVVVRVDPGREGRTLADYPWQVDFANSIPSPAVSGARVLLSAGYNQRRTVLVGIRPGSARKLWESDEFTKVCTPLVHGGAVYTAFRKLRCLDLETGRLRWQGGAFGDEGSCLVTSDGRIVAFGRRRLVLAETAVRSPGSYTELARLERVFRRGTAWPRVVLAGRRVYCKHNSGEIVCYRIRGASP